MTTDETEAALARYHALVDRQFLEGLTPEESAELERLGLAIDDHYTPLYAPAIQTLEALVGQSSAA